MKERIVVFGGQGNMGRVVVERAQAQGHETLVVDPRSEVSADPESAIAWATVIYLSLFPRDLNEVINRFGPKMRPDQLVLENSSVKSPVIPALKSLDEKGVSVVSTHPLAKHDQPLQGIKALVMDVGPNSPRARFFAEEFYKSSGMIVIDHSLDEHDNVMAPEQGLPHALWRAVGKTLTDSGYKPEELWSLAPANAELFWLAGWRTWLQDPKISASIIGNFLGNPIGMAIIDTLIENLQELKDMSADEERLRQSFEETYKRLNTDGMGERMNETTTIVIERLANLRLGSIIVVATEDKPGVLRDISTIFAICGINLTAIDSHLLKRGVKFMIGKDPQTKDTALDQVQAYLTESGFKVLGIQKPQ